MRSRANRLDAPRRVAPRRAVTMRAGPGHAVAMCAGPCGRAMRPGHAGLAVRHNSSHSVLALKPSVSGGHGCRRRATRNVASDRVISCDGCAVAGGKDQTVVAHGKHAPPFAFAAVGAALAWDKLQVSAVRPSAARNRLNCCLLLRARRQERRSGVGCCRLPVACCVVCAGSGFPFHAGVRCRLTACHESLAARGMPRGLMCSAVRTRAQNSPLLTILRIAVRRVRSNDICSLAADTCTARDWARPAHICTRTGLLLPTSAPVLGSSCPHLHREWVCRR